MFYTNLLRDTDVNVVRSTVTAHGTTVGIAGMTHRQRHGTGQGTVEGPINWVLTADIGIAIARQRSSQPVSMPKGTGRSLQFDPAWFVGDSGLEQANTCSIPGAPVSG